MQRAEEFFSWLDLSREGLEAVRSAVEQNDYGKAGEALLAYFDHVTTSTTTMAGTTRTERRL